MNNDQPTKVISKLYKRFLALQQCEADNKQYWKDIEQLNKELREICEVIRAIEVMSKNAIIKLCAMESSLRFMQPFRFLALFSETVKYI